MLQQSPSAGQKQTSTQQQGIDQNGFFGQYGGRHVPDALIPALDEVRDTFNRLRDDPAFQAELNALLKAYAGRPTPLFHAANLTRELGGAKIYLKREDLNHLGAHKINNTLGQVLVAKHMGKRRIIAETGAGQHGVAAAAVASLMGMECEVYMGEMDMKRQELNVFRMRLMGAKVTAALSGQRGLKEAVDEALLDWVKNVDNTFYLIGSAVGPHPYPFMVREFQSVISKEARTQILEEENRLPDYCLACVGGGSNAAGLFAEFIKDEGVKLIGVEPGGKGTAPGEHAATLTRGKPGVLHGSLSYMLADDKGEAALVYSISAGLDYPGVGPEHAYLKDSGRAQYVSVTDAEALHAFFTLSKTEGIIPALESSHALAYAMKLAPTLPADRILLVNLSGRGDKDINQVLEMTAGKQM